MDIKRVAIDTVSEILVVNVEHMDYKGQVQKRINEKMPLATIKGFRKGKVPKSIVEKFYGKEIKQEEVEKVVLLALDQFIKSEKLNVITSPVLKVNEDLDWNAEELVFEYEIGLVPNFEIDFEAKNDIVKYSIIVDDEMIDARVKTIQKRSGKKIPQDVVTTDSDITATFTDKENEAIQSTTIPISVFSNEKYTNKFIGKKVGDVVSTSLKNLFSDDYYPLINSLKMNSDELLDLDLDEIIDYTIQTIYTTEAEELDQKLFDSFFGEGRVTSVEELRAKIKTFEEIEYAKLTYDKLIEDIEDFLVENTKFELPTEFIMKWAEAKEELTPEELKEAYADFERKIRLTLIEGETRIQNNILVTFEEFTETITNMVGTQLTMIQKKEPTDEEVQKLVKLVMKEEKQMQAFLDGMLRNKLCEFFEEKIKPPTKEVTHREFIGIVYKKFIEAAYN